MKIKLEVNDENYESIKKELVSLGIEIDDNSELVLTRKEKFITYLPVKTDDGEKVKISVSDVVFIESCGKDVIVHSKDQSYQSQDRLYQILESLNPKEFTRVSNSVIIAKKYVRKIKPTLSMKYILTMVDGTLIDVTRSYYQDFKKFFGI